MDTNELVQLLSQQAVRQAVIRIIRDEVPAGVIVGTANNAQPKGYRAVGAPPYYWSKE